jgi:endonuclease/exonuclease/phosphatase family metal-dependent hydrolase
MKKLSLPLILFVSLWASSSPAQLDTLRLATYNLLNFPGSDASGRLSSFRTVIKSIDPDILVVQELESMQGLTILLNQVMNYGQENLYLSAPFVNGPDSDNGLLYRQEKITFLGSQQISTDLRDISEYILDYSGVEFRIYSVHLKAGQGELNETRRLGEATILRNYLNDLPPNYNFMVVGDFNLYSSFEPAFIRLTEEATDMDGQLIDPLGAVGVWNNNIAFAAIHTQSTRTTRFGGGASGGVDDRFDMLLVSASLMSEGGMDILPETYTAWGNDGQHFNKAINFGSNRMVADSVAEALFQASDHLPTFADFVIALPTSIENPKNTSQPTTLQLNQNYPNPFNSSTKISYNLAAPTRVTLKVYDLLGRVVAVLVDEFQSSGEHQVEFDAKDLASGVYLIWVKAGEFNETRKLILLR